MEGVHRKTYSEEALIEDAAKGPTISHKAAKVLEECVRNMVNNLPPSDTEKIESRVKRPMNAFMIYSQTARKAMARHYPTLSYRKLSKALGKIWKVLDTEEKKPFIREAERLRTKHKLDYLNYKFKPRKSRKQRAHETTTKEHCVPDAEDLKKIVKTECNGKPSCQKQDAISFFKGYQTPSPQVQQGYLFSERSCMEEELPSRSSSYLDNAYPSLEDAYPLNFSFTNRNSPLEEDLTPFTENLLHGSHEILERELSSTQLNKAPFTPIQPEGNRGNVFDRGSLGLYPVSQGHQDYNFLSNHEPYPFLHYLNGNEQLYSSERTDGNFYNSMSNDEEISSLAFSPTLSSYFNTNSKVFVNL